MSSRAYGVVCLNASRRRLNISSVRQGSTPFFVTKSAPRDATARLKSCGIAVNGNGPYEALQIFTKSAGQWRARELPDEEVALFRRRLRQTRVRPVVAHNSYLINVAAAEPVLRRKSIAALGDELDRAERLGLEGLVMHPG